MVGCVLAGSLILFYKAQEDLVAVAWKHIRTSVQYCRFAGAPGRGQKDLPLRYSVHQRRTPRCRSIIPLLLYESGKPLYLDAPRGRITSVIYSISSPDEQHQSVILRALGARSKSTGNYF